MKLELSIGKGKSTSTIDFPNLTSSEIAIAELETRIVNEVFKKSKDRLRIQTTSKLTLPSGSKATLESLSIQDGDQLILKDLGPQISWKTVFLIEYLGPILIHPFFYFYSELIYRAPVEHSAVQTFTLLFIVLHFLKREYETLFVHRFSHSTMPLSNLFKNCAHYHILAGLLIAYNLYSPKYSDAVISPTYLFSITVLYLFGEISNYNTHVILRDLRPEGTTERKIPTGYGFIMLSCPNYFFETVAWVAIGLVSNNWSVWLFTAVAFGQMYVWAIKKHKQYRKEFSDYPKNRTAIIPYLV